MSLRKKLKSLPQDEAEARIKSITIKARKITLHIRKALLNCGDNEDGWTLKRILWFNLDATTGQMSTLLNKRVFDDLEMIVDNIGREVDRIALKYSKSAAPIAEGIEKK